LKNIPFLIGTDVTGQFATKSKEKCFKLLLKCEPTILNSFSLLGMADVNPETLVDPLYKFVSLLYNSKATSIENTRWDLYRRGGTAEQLPPTRGAFLPHVKRAHYCAKIFKTADDPQPAIWNPEDFGWVETGGKYKPFMTLNGPAPDGILNAVKCSCKKGCGTNRCSCKNNGKVCSELCNCDHNCENVATFGHIELDPSNNDDSDYDDKD
jgi:hypothetical protein